MADLLVCPGIGVFDEQQLAGGGRVSGPERCGSRYLISIFLCRMMGAGDIKCMALICGYLGFASGFFVIGTGMAVGACWSLGKLFYRKQFRDRLGLLTAYIRRTIQEKRLIVYDVSEEDKGK